MSQKNPPPNPPTSIQTAVGVFLRAYRREHRLTLDDVATAGRKHGAAWGPASIRNLETGKSALTLLTLIQLAHTLNRLTDDNLALDDLLGDAVALDVPMYGKNPPVKREWLSRILAGAPVQIRLRDFENGPRWASEVVKSATAELPSDSDFESLEISPTLAETRAARRAGIGATAVAMWSRALWEHSLDEEAAARATSDTPQARGAVTRKLIDEILDALDKQTNG